MARLLSALILVSSALIAAGPADDELKKKPITTDSGEIGKLLQKWWKEGTAAGNVGDWYDNRDGEHSPLDLRPWPHLRKVKYSDDDVKARRHWALQPRTLPHVVFGNSSTSAPPNLSGSNVRSYYCSSAGLALLHDHYRKNNLYIYPEHRDHDPGHNGVGDGYGDLYPTNTPYLITSQGSSGSDQPFMRAVPFTLAAFRPEVKKKLVEAGLLMPTVQMIFRQSNKHLAKPEEYLTGKAHPSVFEGSWVDTLKMVKLAHDIRLDNIPPLVQLRVVEEDRPVPGRDFFEPPGASEQHADTPSAIARIWRGQQRSRKLVVSAADSLDVNKKPLTFRWVVLRGDENRIRITPRDAAGTQAEITIDYHERRPIAPGSAMESNRVDIGVFAHNGVYHSAPAFLTFFSLDNEARSYDDRGRIVEVGYGMGFTELKPTDLPGLFAELSKDELPAQVLQLSAKQRQELAEVAKLAAPLSAERDRLRTKRQSAEQARNKAAGVLREKEKAQKDVEDARAALKAAEAEWKAANEQLTKAEAAFNQLLDGKRDALNDGPRPFVMRALNRAMARPSLWNDHVQALRDRELDPERKQHAARVESARRKLLQLGVMVNGSKKIMQFRPALPGETEPIARLSRFEKAMLEEFNGVLLAELLLPGRLTATFHPNFVDRRLTTPKRWRDVYHHDGDKLVGWTRYHTGETNRTSEFTAEGLRIVERDARGKPKKARKVSYRWVTGRQMWANPNPLEEIDGDEVIDLEKKDGQPG